MKKDCNDFYPPLPPQMKNKWSIIKTLTCSADSQIYIIKNNTNTNTPENMRILKIINRIYFDKKIYKKIMAIKDQHILKPLKIIIFKENCYIITQYHNNLAKLICQSGISGIDILNMAHDICISLKQLHSKKILHLDCTPSNIYLNEDGSFCLGDFSSAAFTNHKTIPVTATTAGYIPPEISEGFSPDFLSDVYIFSCLLYTLFNNGYTVISDNPDGCIKDNIPQELYAIIIKGCSKNPSDRYSSIDEIESELNSLVISEKLSDYNYYLHITEESHPFHYLKTPLINKNTAINHKNKKQSTPDILCIVLILITGTIFLSSLYNYYAKNNLQREKKADISSNTSTVISFPVTPAPTYTPKPLPTVIYTPTPVPEIVITDFDISNKDLTSLPNQQNTNFSCDKLTCLYADNNKIVDIDNIKYYTALKELYLSDNLLVDLSPLEKTDSLNILVLAYNKITDLLPICSLTSLTNLDISGNNQMYNFSELISLYNLKTLNLTNTNVTGEEINFLTYYLPNCEILY